MPVPSPADQMIYTTLFVQAKAKGVAIGTGTAFHFAFKIQGGDHVPLLITNKHVVAGADQVEVSFNVADPKGGPGKTTFSCAVDLGGVIFHPSPDVDLCAIPIGIVTQEAQRRGQPIYAIALAEENIPKPGDWENLDSIEQVLMVGCPRGIFDPVNNVPIVRSGITASNPGVRYNGRDEFMVDMACFPGSSGSPVFQAPTLSRFNRETGRVEIGNSSSFFLGVLYSGPIIDNKGNITFAAPTATVSVSTMMHLGIVIRSSRLLDLKPIVSAHLTAQGLPPLL